MQQIKDIDHFVTTKKQAGIPQFLWGHSMGGGLTIKYALDGPHKDQLQGFVVEAPLIELPDAAKQPTIKLYAGSLLAKLLPDQKLFTQVPVDTCTRDPAFIKSGEADKLLRPYGSLRGSL